MKKGSLAAFLLAVSAGATTASACIQVGDGGGDGLALPDLVPIPEQMPALTFKVPNDPNQLPADVFKLHVHVAVEPLKVEIPLLKGSTVVAGGRETTDPKGDFNDMIRHFEADPARHSSVAERSDYGAALIFAGRYRDAIAVLLQLEKDHPGRYATASNLGTAYELAGDVTKALEWIKAGIARNKNSHQGTEWLHVAILECKQKLTKDPDWLRSHSILEGYEDKDRASKETALEYQINERLYFIKNDDLVMCDLLYEAARNTNNAVKRKYFLNQTGRFGSIRNEQVRELQAKAF